MLACVDLVGRNIACRGSRVRAERSDQSAPVTRAQVKAELEELVNAGYNPRDWYHYRKTSRRPSVSFNNGMKHSRSSNRKKRRERTRRPSRRRPMAGMPAARPRPAPCRTTGVCGRMTPCLAQWILSVVSIGDIESSTTGFHCGVAGQRAGSSATDIRTDRDRCFRSSASSLAKELPTNQPIER
ncbi:DUF4148 domain-containing protein [Burkholderia glumae]|uniref:DUF4148 domain-containing protein n=1 Tax=Burkholderia glumae TaxID=337 RepID=UPI001F1C95AE|nr:DUF4148 domain-containing protein [Burkholderia glumae]